MGQVLQSIVKRLINIELFLSGISYFYVNVFNIVINYMKLFNLDCLWIETYRNLTKMVNFFRVARYCIEYG